MARVVVVGYEHVDPLGEIVSLSDEETKGDWREWVSRRIEFPVDEVEPPFLSTVVPGVSLVVKIAQGVMRGIPELNIAAVRLIYGRSGPSDRDIYSHLYGPAVALIEYPDFDNRLKHISGTQRVAVELAADAEWDVLRRIVARINEGPVRWPPYNPSAGRLP
jgi:hypothetical protein